jgi:hypothetical protein
MILVQWCISELRDFRIEDPENQASSFFGFPCELDFILSQWWPCEDPKYILTFEDFVLIIS